MRSCVCRVEILLLLLSRHTAVTLNYHLRHTEYIRQIYIYIYMYTYEKSAIRLTSVGLGHTCPNYSLRHAPIIPSWCCMHVFDDS